MEHLTVAELIEKLQEMPQGMEIVDRTATTITKVEITDVWSPWEEGTDREHYKAVMIS